MYVAKSEKTQGSCPVSCMSSFSIKKLDAVCSGYARGSLVRSPWDSKPTAYVRRSEGGSRRKEASCSD
jgi:hypothetical protein